MATKKETDQQPQPFTDVEGLSYEQAFDELEQIVSGLEANPPSLEEALALYERGQALAKRCATLLDQAELRVRQLGGGESTEGEEE